MRGGPSIISLARSYLLLSLPGTDTTARIASAVIAIPLLFLVVWVGASWFSALVALAAALGALELCAMARRWGDRPLVAAAVIWSAALVVAAHLMVREEPTTTNALPALSIAVGVALILLLWLPRRGTGLSAWVVTASVALYTGGIFFHAPLLRALDQGREWVLLLLLVTFAADTCALLVGRAVGKHPLAPSISPSKSWEGALGGGMGALAASVAALYVLGLEAALWEALALGALIGTTGQLGDLFVSRLKRIAGVKDSGWLVPGHGGLLDRMDSIAFNLVVVYYFVS